MTEEGKSSEAIIMWKQWWFWVICGLVLIIIVLSFILLLGEERASSVEEFEELEAKIGRLEKQLDGGGAEDVGLEPEIEDERDEKESDVAEETYEMPENVPVEIVEVNVEPPSFIYSELKVVFENVAEESIDEINFVALLFDEKGYPISGRDGRVNGNFSRNLHPGEIEGSNYLADGEARKAKVEIKNVQFFDKEDWRNPDIEKWVAEESGRYD